MKIVIIEDEIVAKDNLAGQIKETEPDTEILAVLSSVQESIRWFSENKSPDLVFMDIHLGDGISFSIFKNVEILCPVIFTTAYDEYSLRAFETNCIDYLLKPITQDKLIPLAVSRIAYIRSDMHMSEFHTLSGECFIKDSSLDTLQLQLDPRAFFRANRQYIIARDAVRDISLWFGGKIAVNMSVSTPERILVSRAKASGFKNWLQMPEQ